MLDTQNSTPAEADIGLLEDWISRHDLAISLGVSEDTLWRWDMRRTGPQSIKLGRKVYYRRSSVQDWISAQEQTRPVRTRRGRK